MPQAGEMNQGQRPRFRCVVHGSFQKHFSEIKETHKLFADAGIEVLAPEPADITNFKNGFAVLQSDASADPRMIELLYLRNLKRLGGNGFSYFVNPEGYIGKSVSYELGIAQLSNIRCFFMETPADHPAYVQRNSVWKPERLAEFIIEQGELPKPRIQPNEKVVHALFEDLMVPGSVVAVGGIIEYVPAKPRKEKEILLVKTHKWGGKYSMVGGRVRRNERLGEALVREIKEETGLKASVGEHICTFDEIRDSGYYHSGIQHIFVDKIAQVSRKNVVLNEEAEDFAWIPPRIALNELPMEPNARHTVELYARMFCRA